MFTKRWFTRRSVTGLLARESLVEDKVKYCRSPLYQPTVVRSYHSMCFGVHGIVHNSWLIKWLYGT